jgi:hypothetical protein
MLAPQPGLPAVPSTMPSLRPLFIDGGIMLRREVTYGTASRGSASGNVER